MSWRQLQLFVKVDVLQWVPESLCPQGGKLKLASGQISAQYMKNF